MQDNKELMKKALLEIQRLKQLCVKNNSSESCAVVGMACRLPGGIGNTDDYWRLLCNSESGITEIPSHRWNEYGKERFSTNPYLKKAGFLCGDIEEFDNRLFRILPDEAAYLDPQQRLALEVCWELFENSGYSVDEIKNKKIGVFVGVVQNDFGHENLLRKDEKMNLTGMDFAFLSGRISYFFGLNGPSMSIDTACSSSSVAIDTALKYLKDGDCDMALVCGVNIMFSPEITEKISSLGILSESCEVRAFDKYADGTVRGEGVAAILLKKLSDAEKDGNSIHSLIIGSALNQDGASTSLTAPNGVAQKELLKTAWKKSGITSDEIDYIETHGTGTSIGDPIEIKAIAESLSENRKNPLYIGSVKTNIGHLEGAAGIIGVIKATLMLEHKKIPESLNFNTPSEYINWSNIPVKVADKLLDWNVEGERRRTAGVSSFGLSGTNSHIVLREYGCSRVHECRVMPLYPFAFTAVSKKSLRTQLESFLSFLRENPDCNLTSLSYTHNITRAALNERVLISSESRESLEKALQTAINGRLSSSSISAPKKVVFAFTGQGSQYNNMCAEFYKNNRCFRESFDRCGEYFKKFMGLDLNELVFSDKYDLSQTLYTQPAIFAVEYALACMWQSLGVNPDIVLGHSIGEYAAACIAGIFSLEDAVKLVSARGKALQSFAVEGKMLAVFTDRESVEEIIEGCEEVYVSVSNSQQQTVVAGTEKAVNKLISILSDKSVKYSVLNTTRPFHTPLMNNAAEEFRKTAEGVKYNVPKIKIISNVTSHFESALMTSADYWTEHILSEVHFYDSVKKLGDTTDMVFLEIGAMPILSGIIGKITDGEALCEYSADKSTVPERHMAEVLGKLYVNGVSVDFKSLYKEYDPALCQIPNYSFDKRKIPYIHTIDRSAKSYESPSASELYEFEDNEAESTYVAVSADGIKKILADFLGIENNELTDGTNLLRLGIDSVNAVRLLRLVNDSFGVKLSLNDVFNDCTLSGIVKLIERGAAASDNEKDNDLPTVSLDEENRYKPFPLNEIQYAYWAGRDNKNMLLSGSACCAYFEADIENLDIDRFLESIKKLEERHDMLRCRITEDAEQYILEESKPDVKIYDFSGKDKSMLEEIRSEMSHKILPLNSPMYEIRISKLDGNLFRIHFLVDFMIADAMSLYIFWNDLEDIYNGKTLEKFKITFRDYQNYCAGSESLKSKRDEDEKYWLSRLDDFPKAPELPYNKSVFVDNSDRKFVRRRKNLSQNDWKKFSDNAAKYGLTPSAALFTLYSEVLSAYGGGNAFAVMLTVFRRLEVNEDINKIIGDFTKLAPVEVYRKNVSVAENAVEIQKRIMENISHSDYSAVEFTDKLRKHNGDERMYNVIFTSAVGVSVNKPTELNEEKVSFIEHLRSVVSSTPQVCLDHQVFFENGNTVLSWDTLDEVFLENVVDSMFEVYSRLVDSAVNNPEFFDTVLTDLRPDSQKLVHNKVNETQYPYNKTLLTSDFSENVRIHPEKTAVVCDGVRHTYRQLDEKSNQVAQCLIQNLAKKGDRVLIDFPKSFEQLYSVLGVLKAGCVYVPLTHNQPLSRTQSIIEKSKPMAIISSERKDGLGIKCYTPDDFSQMPGQPVYADIIPSDGAYIIYTSGSTGVPKGVYITHEAAMNTVADVNRRYNINEEDSALAVSALSFDLSVYDIFGMLSAGGTVVLPTENQRIDPKMQYRLVEENGVTVWNSVPAIMDIYADFLIKKSLKSQSLRRVILSGDWIPINLPEKLNAALPSAKLTSMGGATEASIWSNYYDVEELDEGWKSVPYGYPLANQQFYITDEYGRRCPDYVSGRLHIGGEGLARGYYNEPELTAAAFYTLDGIDGRLYNTGDYGRYHTGGIIEFLGRKDGQIKINGYRIETAEIEASIKKCGITDRAIALPIGSRMKKLAVFIETEKNVDSELLKENLRKYLPQYFIPDTILPILRFPVTANGKVDVKQLSALYEEFKGKEKKTDTSTEEKNINPVLRQIRRILDISNISEKDSFGSFGVSSVDMIRLADELESIYGVRPSISRMIAYQSVSELLEFFGDREEIAKKSNDERAEQTVRRVNPDEEDGREENPTEEYEKLGIQLFSEDGKLKFKAAKGTVTGDILEKLKQDKEKILSYLTKEEAEKERKKAYIRENSFALTPIQKAYMIGRSDDYELGGTSAHYYTETAWIDLDADRLEDAVNKVIDNNDMLQAIVLPNGTQVILEEVPYYKINVSNVTEEEFLGIRNKWSAYKYEVGKWPMFDVFVSIIDGKRTVVHFSFDCILLDGWSANMMIAQIFNVYKGREIKKPTFTFRNYVERKESWLENKEYYAEATEFWNREVKTLPKAPLLPYREEFAEVKKPHFERKKFVLSKEKTLKLNDMVKKNSMTASSAICTAYMKIISNHSAESDLTLNLTLFNRLPIDREVWSLLGDFTNITLVPYRKSLKGNFMSEAQAVRDFIVKAIEYRTYNGLELLKSFSGEDVFKAVMPVVFTSLLFGSLDSEEQSEVFDEVKEVYSISQTPQVALDHQVLVRNGELVLIWDYVKELFDDDVIETMFNEYTSLVERLSESGSWYDVY